MNILLDLSNYVYICRNLIIQIKYIRYYVFDISKKIITDICFWIENVLTVLNSYFRI